MPIRQLNPREFAELNRRQQAEIIAKEKRKLKPDYKLKSAYRYLQRAAAPEGKQRIIHPRLERFLPPKLVGQVDRGIKIAREALRTDTPHARYLESLRDLGERVRRGELVIQKPTLPEGSLADKIAVLINKLTYDTAADILDVDDTLLDKVVTGTKLNRHERYEIEEQFSHLMRDAEVQDEYDIDTEYIESKASLLTHTIQEKDIDDQNVIREGIADSDIDLEKFSKAVSIFPQLNNAQLARILDTYADQKRGVTTYHHKRDEDTGLLHKGRKMRAFDINEMFDAAALDDYDISNVSESEFWAWFRELFY